MYVIIADIADEHLIKIRSKLSENGGYSPPYIVPHY